MSAPTPRQIFEFETYGFTVLERVLPEAEAQQLAEATSRADARFGTARAGLNDVQRRLLRMERSVGQPSAADYQR